jgi:DNA-binding transcriptional LysR family regulator
MSSSAWSSVFYSIKAGLGVGVLPCFLAEQDPTLEALEFVKIEKMPLWWVVHPEVKKSARVDTFAKYMIPILKDKI